MTHLCVTCGTQFPPADHSPERCPICEDERQFVGLQGQQWTTLDKLRQTHRNSLYQGGRELGNNDLAGIWDRTAGTACANRQRQHSLGLREPD